MRFMQATGIKQRSGFCLLGITSSRSGTARSAAHAEECSDGVTPLAACVAYSTIMFVISSRYLTNDNGLKRGEQQRRDAVATISELCQKSLKVIKHILNYSKVYYDFL